MPGEKGPDFQQFSTERPRFAQDDLLAELKSSGATVSAKPVTQERGTLSNCSSRSCRGWC